MFWARSYSDLRGRRCLCLVRPALTFNSPVDLLLPRRDTLAGVGVVGGGRQFPVVVTSQEFCGWKITGVPSASICNKISTTVPKNRET